MTEATRKEVSVFTNFDHNTKIECLKTMDIYDLVSVLYKKAKTDNDNLQMIKNLCVGKEYA